jgi:hypothetical protein
MNIDFFGKLESELLFQVTSVNVVSTVDARVIKKAKLRKWLNQLSSGDLVLFKCPIPIIASHYRGTRDYSIKFINLCNKSELTVKVKADIETVFRALEIKILDPWQEKSKNIK